MEKQDFMRHAIALAKNGVGAVDPNPLVGAVIVKDGEIIVDVYLMMRYGYVIPETARKVQDSVSAAVSGMTGYNVHAVNVHVGGISFN